MRYYWHVDDNPPPQAIRDPSQLGEIRRLAIACTQTDLTPARQRALVKEWCKLLPTLTGISTLWLQSRVPQDLFDAACAVPGLEGLWIKWSGGGIKDLSGLAHAPGLRYFHLGSSTSVASIDALAGMRRLSWLGLESLTKISDVSPIQELTNLEGLALDGSTWTTWKIDSLHPLANLRELRFLSLVNLRANSNTLRPLYNLRQLETLHLAQWWDPLEVIEIQNRNPNLAA